MCEREGCSVILLGAYLMFLVTFSVTIGRASNELWSITLCLHSNKICTQKAQIGCSHGQKIRIHNITYFKSDSNRNSCNSGCSGSKQVLNVTVDESRITNLFIYEKCSYRESCQLNNSIRAPQGIGENIWFIDVEYSCISYDDVIDFCESVEETVNDELHIVTDINITNVTCECIVSENTKMVITEYRPCYRGICKHTDMYIDGEKQFDCGVSCKNLTYSNIPSDNIDKRTNVTISGVYDSMFFWLSISKRGKGNATVVCNKNDSHTVPISTLDTETGTQTNEGERGSPIPIIQILGGVVGSIVAFATIIAVFITFIKCIWGRKPFEQPTGQEAHYRSPQCHTDSKQLVSGLKRLSNNAYEMQDGLTAGASGISQANREEEGDSSVVDEYAVIEQTDDTVYSSDHYAIILDDGHTRNIANATVSYCKAGHYDALKSNNPHTTAKQPQYEDNESEYDVTSTNLRPRRNLVTVETLRYPDIYSHINQTDNVSMAQKVGNYSHINVAQSSDNYSKIERVGYHQGIPCQDDYSHLTISPSYN